MAQHHLFLSYKRGDAMTSVVERMQRRLQVQFRPEELKVFFDRKSIDAGASWETAIDAFLAETTLFVAFISIDFWLSPQCMRELGIALRRYRRTQAPRLLFVLADFLDPSMLSLDDAALKPHPREAAQDAATLSGEITKMLAESRANGMLADEEPYSEGELGQFNFLGPYDGAGRLVRLEIDNFRVYDEQLQQLIVTLRGLIGRS